MQVVLDRTDKAERRAAGIIDEANAGAAEIKERLKATEKKIGDKSKELADVEGKLSKARELMRNLTGGE